MIGQTSLFTDNAEYDAFVDKFKPKKTTDDCYTPQIVYDAVCEWVCAEYGVDRADFVRPFWPGGDYETFDYPDGCVVVDNPPFSIISRIVRFYLKRGIRFFLFAPALTMVKLETWEMATNLVCGCDITYENGATVKTSFTTNLGDTDAILRTCPELYEAVEAANAKNQAAFKKTVPKYEYPDHVISFALAQKLAQHGTEFKLSRRECVHIPALDAQRAVGKSIFGAGYLMSDHAAAERAAAERAAAERAAAERWELSARERGIVEMLGREDDWRIEL